MRITTRALVPLTLLAGVSAWAQNPRSYQAKYTATAPKIDGVVAAGEWDAASTGGDKWGVLRLAETAKDKENARFKILWDNQFLYLLFQSDYKNWSAGIGNNPVDNVPGTQNQGIVFGDDNINIYIDPNTDEEENDRDNGSVDGYQLAWNQRQGVGSLLNGVFRNTGLFLEGHINTPFGNQAKWQGLRKSSFVQNHGNTGGIIEFALAWEDIDSPNQTGAEWADALDSFPEDGSLWHPFSPKNGDKWIFNISRITSDQSNFLPIWSWHDGQPFAEAPHGILEFTGRPEVSPLAWYKINSVTVDTPEPPFDTYVGNNLIQGPGVGYDAAAPYDQLGGGGTHRWVTIACGFPCDYLADRPTPKLIFDLGQDRTLGSVDLWGYAATNANGVKKLKIRFATAADGNKGFGKSIGYSPTFELPNDDKHRMPRVFTQKVKARYVEIECLDNYFVEPGNTQGHPLIKPGGDRVGLGEVAFPVTAEDAPPIAGDLVAYWDFETGTTPTVGSLKATLEEDAKIVAAKGKNGAGLDVESNPAAEMLIADASSIGAKLAAKDQVTVSFWQKNTNDVRDQSAFWFQSESSSGGQRGIQVHTPWSNGRIYFDTAGCCGGTQRTDEAAGDVDFNQWNHFAFVKDKAVKKIYVNGKLLIEKENEDPLPSDLKELHVGNNAPTDTRRSVPGILDEFAIWASAVSEADIKKLAAGASPGGGSGAPPKAALTGSTVAREALTLEYTDAGSSVLDTASVKLKVDGKDVTPSVTAAGGKTTIVYKPSPIFDWGSTHTFEVTAKDKAGAAISDKGEVKLPTPIFPEADLVGPKPAKDAWGTRFIFETGESVTGIKNIFRLIDAAGKAGFAGIVTDENLKTINFGDQGYFADSPGYPQKASDKGCCGEDFINLNIAHLKVTKAGLYTFGIHTDDGFGLRIKGAKFISKSGAGALDRTDPSVLVHPSDTGDSNTRGVAELAVGVYRIEFFWWERGGGDHGEIYVAEGSFANDADTDTWKLVGDPTSSLKLTDEPVTTGGGSPVTSRPRVSTVSISGANILIGSQGTTGLETSTDLKTWTPVNGAPVNGVFTTPRGTDKTRFYRAK